MSDTEFITRLHTVLFDSLFNNFGKENFDELRFGPYQRPSLRSKFNDLKRKKSIPINELTDFKCRYEYFVSKYVDGFNCIYKNIEEPSRQLLLAIIAYRTLGYRRIMLPTNNAAYWEALKNVKRLKDPADRIDPKFMHFMLERFDLREIGYDLQLYLTDLGIVIDFVIEQYACKVGNETVVCAAEGDTVLDCGGCWGDTALYFAHKVGAAGRVYSFEFVPNNISILRTNLDLNSKLKDRITLIDHPVWEVTGANIYYRDFGPGSVVSSTPLENQTGSTTTLAIDDFVEREKIPKVDYIKMDIEGAELSALKGALKTIKKYRPKLAIAIYHSAEDFANIPKWLIGLGLNYKFYLGHYTIHSEETVFFAIPK